MKKSTNWNPPLKIGLDIDGVVADFEMHLYKWFNLPTNRAIKWDDERIMDNFKKIEDNEEFWLSIPAIAKQSDLDFRPHRFVTARPIHNDWTTAWLKKQGFKDFELVTVGVDGKKSLHMDNLDVFVDDAIHNYLDVKDTPTKSLLLFCPHNRHYKTRDFIFHLNQIKQKFYGNNIVSN